jgi:type I restriction enzyme S subunit
MSETSKKWDALPIGDVADINVRPKKGELDDDTLASFIPMKCVEAESGRFASPEDKKVGKVKKGYTPMRDGDVIFAKVTPCMENGKAAVVRGLTNGIGFGSTEFYSLRPKETLSSEFLFYYIIQQGFRREAERHMTGAVGLRRVPKAFIAEHEIPLPPLPEQRRIVARIEELFSRLDAGVAALRHAKAQLQRYRQSVLAAAVTGQLTQAWREQHPDTEPASELLERVLKQKREQWDGKRKYKEPPTPVTEDLPELPASWTWATVAQQAAPEERAITDGPFGSKLKSSHYTDSGPRVLRLQNIGDGVFKDEYAHISEEHFETLRNHEIFAGDLVIRALGIPAHQACLVPPSVGPAIVKADCIRFKVFEPHINPRLTLFALNSYPVRSRSEKHIHGVGRPRLNGTEIKSIALPLAPLAEQHQIVAEVEARTTAIDHLETELDRQITRSNRLRQSTLAAAFSGRI